MGICGWWGSLNVMSIITIRNKVAKVMFLQVCVCPQGGIWSGPSGGVWGCLLLGGGVCSWGMSAPGVCSQGGCLLWGVSAPREGVCSQRGLLWVACLLWGGVSAWGCLLWGVSAPGGVFSLGVSALGGVCFQGCLHWGRPPPGETATAADDMHPTGMHSCYKCLLLVLC